jgi:hypothetical protein
MKQKFIDRKFGVPALKMVELCNTIIAEYQAAGYMLTLRQLYYQLVSRAAIPNKDTEYKRLGDVINDARLAGLVDWEAIEDRGRFVRAHAHWQEPADIVESASQQFRVDMWENQAFRPEVWVEKDALVGVVGVPAGRFDIPYFSCRGYTSVTALYEAATRLHRYKRQGQTPMIIHLGDHDPSGIDMTRDIRDRLGIFGLHLEVKRVALNMDQVEQYTPPPNPAKVTDSRYDGYMVKFGEESWELDALEPSVLDAVVTSAIEGMIDQDKWDKQQKRQDKGRRVLIDAAEEMRL